MLDNPFSFEGRIRRTDYLLSLLISILILYILISSTIDLASIAQKDEENAIAIIGFILNFWFIVSAGAKRCHDLGNSGWWQFTPKNLLQSLIQEGQLGNNSFDINPKDFNAINHFTSKAPLIIYRI